MWTHPHHSETPPPALSERTFLDPAEVSMLWSFVHGDIMIGGIREQLRRALGLCARHTWGYFVTEVELWLYGPAPRGGHLPFDVGVLYQDLLTDVIGKISSARSPSRHGLRSALSPKGPCRICADLSTPGDGVPLGYAGSNADALAEEAAELTYTKAWLLRTQEHWTAWVCPACTLPDSPSNAVSALCRNHLARFDAIAPEEVAAIVSHLDDARRRLYRSVDSMTQGGRQATTADDAAVIETLGWFAGWEFPLSVIGRQER